MNEARPISSVSPPLVAGAVFEEPVVELSLRDEASLLAVVATAVDARRQDLLATGEATMRR